MPRQRRGAAPTPARSAPTRPTAAPARPAAAPSAQHSQPHSTAAHPQSTSQQAYPHPPPQAAPVQQSAGPGLFVPPRSFYQKAQQAAPAEAQPMDTGLWQSNTANSSYGNPACETDVRNFRQCMDENQGNLSICGWYLDQLNAGTWWLLRVLTGITESLPGRC
ncbi:hypothetical protein Ao3042_05891 [Aspergillus oryzae 3.042]|uniref:CHCH domain protein n=1 Tax=Aspergillus oryzae (strain 3.042) TaxID=1160506 RepID=I7ZZY4_ASPO3|nr:hypothetical protein Ao3042_05891 [Aspergillus oryzae 3.042]|eukprot:EIT77872.1 hypothetical protein Ao3042_05891 [Aspergillus oryzae 3.042]